VLHSVCYALGTMSSAQDILNQLPRRKLYFGMPLRVYSNERSIWTGMLQRCYNPALFAYRWYGAKGVTVCERWRRSFANFLIDMGPRPSREHSIDRIDPTGNYEPGNCRWATRIVQANNKRPRVNPLLVELDAVLKKLGKS